MTFIEAAEACRASLELIAQDVTAGVDQVKPLADAARSLGQQWASSGDSGKPTSATIIACFAGWLDLEDAFSAGIRDIELRDAEDRAMEAAEAAASNDADDHLDLERKALLTIVPGLQAWCLQHPRATHRCAWPLFDHQDDPDHLAALAFLVEHAVDLEPAPDGGLRLCTSAPRRWIQGNTLVDVVDKARHA